MFRRAITEFRLEINDMYRLVREDQRPAVREIFGRLANPLSVADIAVLTSLSQRQCIRLAKLDPLEDPIDVFTVQSGRGPKRKFSEEKLPK